MKALSLNISTKGMILVAVPLVFELVFVGVLASMLHQSDEQTKKLARSREIVAEINKLTQCYLDAGIALVAWKATHSNSFMRKYDDGLKLIPPIQKNLDDLSAGDSARREHVDRFKAAGDKIIYLTQQFRRPGEQSMVILMDPVSYRQEIAHAYEHLMQESQSLDNDERATQMANPEEGTRFREKLRTMLYAGVGFNVLLTIALAWFFSQNVTRRLAVLAENSRLLAQREKLKPLVGGDDEISQLDESFHDMASLLGRAEQRKQEYISMISHDLRTPLAAIQGTIAVANRGSYGVLNEKGIKRMSAAESDAERLIGLINEMLDYEKLDSGTFELDKTTTMLSSITDSAINAVRPLSEQKNISIFTTNSDTTIYCDQDRVIRVIINLLGNAIKFSGDGTTIKIEAVQNKEGTVIRIKDSGRGIPAASIGKIFDRFTQVETADATKHGGSGLGLAICKAIVEAHGGKIGCESVVGKGTTFWMTFPPERASRID
jgi:signal transduction histidine kinase